MPGTDNTFPGLGPVCPLVGLRAGRVGEDVKTCCSLFTSLVHHPRYPRLPLWPPRLNRTHQRIDVHTKGVLFITVTSLACTDDKC